MFVNLAPIEQAIKPLPESLSFLSVPEYQKLSVFFYNIESGIASHCWETELLPNLNPIDRIKLDQQDNFMDWKIWIDYVFVEWQKYLLVPHRVGHKRKGV